MSHRRIPKRKAVLAGAGAVGIAAAAILLPQANASQSGQDDDRPTVRTMTAASAAQTAKQLAGSLGDSYGGAYYDAGTRRLVVNVAGEDRALAERVEAAGAVAKTVRNGVAALAGATRTLSAEAGVPGTAWAVDPRTNQVLVTADRTVTGARWDRLESTVRGLGEGVAEIRRSKGEFRPFADGGDAIFGGGARCSLGFNVTTSDGARGFLTAGHCTVAAQQWSDGNGAVLGSAQESVFPGEGDFGLVTYDDPAAEAPDEVDLGDGQRLAIKGTAEAAVGQQVFRMGSTTGLRDGQVTGLNATVNYPEGTVTGLIQTDVCAEPGDSGGSLFTRDGDAIGLTSGGSGDCDAGGETFFQPVTTALAAVGATIGDAEQPPGQGGQEGQDQGGAGEEDQGQGEQGQGDQDPGDQGQGSEEGAGQDQEAGGQDQDAGDQGHQGGQGADLP
ncbi:S1 family peptidase [Streptomyces lichenis]|uniref:S1 family peptidase n=1 Tax=Streptomyces lichenis TaxID=2306967 RepID=A0ABT0IC03_9ACTN|nr:S1 family peptidase [Streptomyces lichenis]MCK8678840.1 S1 family peptidase [Streptomyces lichenis]